MESELWDQIENQFKKKTSNTGADAINISGLLNTKKLGNFINWML